MTKRGKRKKNTTAADKTAAYRKRRSGIYPHPLNTVPPAQRLGVVMRSVTTATLMKTQLQAYNDLLSMATKGKRSQKTEIGGKSITLAKTDKGVASLLHKLAEQSSGSKGVTVAGFDISWSWVAPWLLKSDDESCVLHNDLPPDRGVPGRGSDLWTCLLCLEAKAPYTFRVWARCEEFATGEETSDKNYIDVAMTTGTWVCFPSRHQHQVIGGTARRVLNFLYTKSPNAP